MAARVVNLAGSDDDYTLYGSEEEARQALASMMERFRLQGYTVTEQRFPDEVEAQYKVIDPDGEWTGTYTIVT
jgi:hypothetical protein